MTDKEKDALWWQYFAECGSSCGIPLPARVAESVIAVSVNIVAMMQVWDISVAAGDFTLRGFFFRMATKAPAAYSWVLLVFPTVVRAATSTFVSGTADTYVAGGFAATGTQVIGRSALSVGQYGTAGAGMVASAYLGFLIGAAAYASLRLRGFDLAADGSSLCDFFAWQQSTGQATFFDWWEGGFAADKAGEDMKFRLEKRRADTVRLLVAAESKKKIQVPKAIYSQIRAF